MARAQGVKQLEELEQIRKKLKSAADDKSEEERLLGLFDSACEGLASQTSAGVREEVEEALGVQVEAIEQKAAAIKRMLRE